MQGITLGSGEIKLGGCWGEEGLGGGCAVTCRAWGGHGGDPAGKWGSLCGERRGDGFRIVCPTLGTAAGIKIKFYEAI